MESVQASGSTSLEPALHSRRTAALHIGSSLAAAVLASRLVPAAAQETSPIAGTTGADRAYLVVRQYRFSPGHTMEDLIDAVTVGFIPIVREVPGFMEYYFVETADGLLTISVFQDQIGAEESTRRAADWIEENLAGFYEGPPTVTTGTVRLHEDSEVMAGTPVP